MNKFDFNEITELRKHFFGKYKHYRVYTWSWNLILIGLFFWIGLSCLILLQLFFIFGGMMDALIEPIDDFLKKYKDEHFTIKMIFMIVVGPIFFVYVPLKGFNKIIIYLFGLLYDLNMSLTLLDNSYSFFNKQSN